MNRRRVLPVIGAVLLLIGALGVAMLYSAWQRTGMIEPARGWLVVDRHGRHLGDLGGPAPGVNGFWPLDEVPERVAAATLALEDRRFDRHRGVDWRAVLRALRDNLACRCVHSGASTVAMQVARLQDPAPRTLRNKAREALTARLMVARHGREAVLRQYLRLVPYANGSHGIAHVARLYLDKSVDALSWAEIAFLSAIPHAPDRLNPVSADGRQRAQARAARILDRLHEQEVIDQADHELARQQIVSLSFRPPPRRPDNALHALAEFERRLQFEAQPSGRVRVPLDLDVQNFAARRAAAWLDGHRDQAVEQVAVMVVERESRAVRAMIGSSGFGDPRGGAIDFSRVRRSPGSVLKPFVYALALEHGVIAPDTPLADRRNLAPGVRNADRRFLGQMLPRQALASSRNVPAAGLATALGLGRALARLEALGLVTESRAPEYYGAGLAIGSLPVSLREVMAAFAALASDGRYRPLDWLGLADAPAIPVMAPDSARLVTRFLADPMARLPVFGRMGELETAFPAAVKTGTSQSLRDAWAVIYTSDYLVGVWAGRADGAGMGEAVRGAAAAGLARDILGELYDHPGAPGSVRGFAAPRDYRLSRLCLDDGRPAGPDCARIGYEWLPPADSPSREPAMPFALARDTAPRRPRITRPASGTVFWTNPELPPELEFIRFEAGLEEGDSQIVWYVNGRPQAVTEPGKPFDWPMQTGRHRVSVGLPWQPERSASVVVEVRG